MLSYDSDIHFFHYHCRTLGREVAVKDWLIPYSEMESALRMEGTLVTCIHCGREHPLFIRKGPRSERLKTIPAVKHYD
jgi:hypothetical protein